MAIVTIVAMPFLQLHGASKAHERGAARLLAAHPATDVLVGEEIEMRGDLGAELVVEPRRAEEAADAGQQDEHARQHAVTDRRAAASGRLRRRCAASVPLRPPAGGGPFS